MKYYELLKYACVFSCRAQGRDVQSFVHWTWAQRLMRTSFEIDCLKECRGKGAAKMRSGIISHFGDA